jgi:hypothetical protein
MRRKRRDLTAAEVGRRRRVVASGLEPEPHISTIIRTEWQTQTHRIALVSNIRGARGHFVSKTAEVVAQIFLVVDCVHSFPKTPRLVTLLVSFHWTYIQAVAQQKFLVERC